MDVGVVEREVAVLSLADNVGQAAQREEIDVLVEKDAVVEGEAFARFDFVGDLSESGIVGRAGHRVAQRSKVRFEMSNLNLEVLRCVKGAGF